MYCAHDIVAQTVEEVIEHAIDHVKAEHSFTDDSLLPEAIALWRSRIRDVPDTSGTIPS